MNSKLSKTEAQKKIDNFFSNLDGKNNEQIRKMKRLAMHHHISLNKYKRKYCKKCFSVFNSKNSEIRIKKGMKIIKCKNCGIINRMKINTQG